MNVVAINASPSLGKGNTALILDPFLRGLEAEGADVQLFYTSKLDIQPCHGEFHCWTRHPGECFQDDDVEDLLGYMKEAEVWVFATPLFVDGMSGPLKTLLDRMIPLIQPFVEEVDGRCRHPRREDTKGGKVVLVSNCGFWELENFDPLLVHMEAICKNVGREFAGALLRPHGPALGAMLKRGLPVGDVLEAAEAAGRQLAVDRKMEPETLNSIRRELIQKNPYIENMNENFGAAIERWAERRRTKSPQGGPR